MPNTLKLVFIQHKIWIIHLHLHHQSIHISLCNFFCLFQFKNLYLSYILYSHQAQKQGILDELHDEPIRHHHMSKAKQNTKKRMIKDMYKGESMQLLVVVHMSKTVGKSKQQDQSWTIIAVATNLNCLLQVLGILQWRASLLKKHYCMQYKHKHTCQRSTKCMWSILSRLYLVLLQWEDNALPIGKVTHANFHHY